MMDIFKQARELPLGDELEHIFKMQKEIDPVNSSEYNKGLIKSIALDVLTKSNKSYLKYHLMYSLKMNSSEEVDYTENIYDFNLALAETLHHLIKLISALNLGYSDVFNYYETLLNERKLTDVYLFKESLTATATLYGRYNNIMDRLYNNPEINLRPVVRWKQPVDNFLKGGTILNEPYHELMISFYWAFHTSMFTAIESLPGPHHQDFNRTHKLFMEVWLHLFKIMDFLGHDRDSIGRLYSVYYHLKNQDNVKST